MKRLLFGLIFLMVVCTCGCVDVGEVEPEITPPTIAEPTVTSSTPIVTIPYTTPEPTETPPSPTSVPTPTPTPKTTETIYYTFSYPDVVTVNITVPIEDVAETEKFFGLLDDAQDYMLNADDNSYNAFLKDDDAKIISWGLEPGKDDIYWRDAIGIQEEAIAFSKVAITDYEYAKTMVENAKSIAPTNSYKKTCKLYITLIETDISMEEYAISSSKNSKNAYGYYKQNSVSTGDRYTDKSNEDVKKRNHEVVNFNELIEELSYLIENL